MATQKFNINHFLLLRFKGKFYSMIGRCSKGRSCRNDQHQAGHNYDNSASAPPIWNSHPFLHSLKPNPWIHSENISVETHLFEFAFDPEPLIHLHLNDYGALQMFYLLNYLFPCSIQCAADGTLISNLSITLQDSRPAIFLLAFRTPGLSIFGVQ